MSREDMMNHAMNSCMLIDFDPLFDAQGQHTNLGF